ncbi:MAG: CsbD family protein [Candidatus Acidiferrales bacterium]
MSATIRREEMKQSTKDQIAGGIHKLKGNIKEKAGQITNNANLEAEGKAETFAGNIQKTAGQVEKVPDK